MKQINFCGVVYYSLLAVFTAVFTGCASEGENNPPKIIQSSGVLTAKCLTYEYKYMKAEDYRSESFEILCNGTHVVYGTSADYLSFISVPQEDAGETDDVIKPRDIDGDGTPDLIVQETNGNCCLDYTVVSLGNVLREYKLQNVGADFELVDINGDGKFEIRTTDTTFFENPTGSKFEEPVPQIVLESKDGRYEFSQRFMKDDSTAEFSDRIVQIKKRIAATGEIPPPDKNSIVEWIYRGRGDEALNYLDAVYDGTAAEVAKNQMADEIVMTILDSPHWEQISAMNKWRYAQPDGELACPEFAGRRWLIKTK